MVAIAGVFNEEVLDLCAIVWCSLRGIRSILKDHHVVHTVCHLIKCGDKVLLILCPCQIEAGGRQHPIYTISLKYIAMRERRLVVLTPYMGSWEEKTFSLASVVNYNLNGEVAVAGRQ